MANEEINCQPNEEVTRKRKQSIEEDLKDSNYPCKRVKQWDSWEDCEDLMHSSIPQTNCRWKEGGPSDLNSEVWPEIWDEELYQELRRMSG